MRARLIAAGIAFVLASGFSAAAEGNDKGPKPDVGDGRVAWFDITTTNLAQSRAFYEQLLGWQFTSLKGTDRALEIVSGDRPIGTLRVADGKISPFDGVVYIQVSDLPGKCAKAKELGGMIPPGFPFDLSDDKGAIAVVADPSGHPIGMYSRTPLPKAGK
jgi:predicted enzyme related to lactoylglutathione lyase